MLKKILFSFFLFSLLIVSGQKVLAQNSPGVNVYFFWGDGCPHCITGKSFLEKIEQKYLGVKVYDYETWYNASNRNLLIKAGKKLNADVSGVPFTIIGDTYIVGYYNNATTGREIERRVISCLANQCVDVVGPLIGIEAREYNKSPAEDIPGSATVPVVITNDSTDTQSEDEQALGDDKGEKIINLPILGEIDALNFSLPILTIVIGALDGFNPCAMWTLLFLISLLLGMKDRKKMWILGSAFIIASASVYFVFMAAWLNLILFIGLVIWVRIIIGLVALTGGGYYLKEYFTSPQAVCKVTGSEKKQKVFEKLKSITQHESFYLALGGIILLAFAVNLVELICSAGLPAVYTQVLVLNNLPEWQYYLYLLLYIFVFMLDDLFIFIVAMTTLQMTGITTKYSRWSHLIGGILMIIIGLLLLFKPEWLMFG